MAQDNSQSTKGSKAATTTGKYLHQLNPLLNYLKELLGERALLLTDIRFVHMEKLIDKEIMRVQTSIFASYGIFAITDSDLPEGEGNKVTLQEKVYMPDNKHNGFNFVGRILGPGGSTTQCLQQCLGVKLMVRGRGSMRDGKMEQANLGKPKWEHLNEKLHIVLSIEDYQNRAKARLAKAAEYVKLFLAGSMKALDKDDDVKQMQQLELMFRRGLRSWQATAPNLFSLPFPSKTPALYANNSNYLTYGYAFPPTPFVTTGMAPHHQNADHSLGIYEHPTSHPHHHRQQHQAIAPPNQDHQLHRHHQQQQQLQVVICQGQNTHALANSFPSTYIHTPHHHQLSTNVLIGNRPPNNGSYSTSISPMPNSNDPNSRELFSAAAGADGLQPTTYPSPYGYWTTGLPADFATFPPTLNGYTAVAPSTSTAATRDMVASNPSHLPILIFTGDSSDLPAAQTLRSKRMVVNNNNTGGDKQPLQNTNNNNAGTDENLAEELTIDYGDYSDHDTGTTTTNYDGSEPPAPLQAVLNFFNNNHPKQRSNRNKMNTTSSMNSGRSLGTKLTKTAADEKVRYSQKHMTVGQHVLNARNTGGRPRPVQLTVNVGSGVISTRKIDSNKQIQPELKTPAANSSSNLKNSRGGGVSVYLDTEWPELGVGCRETKVGPATATVN